MNAPNYKEVIDQIRGKIDSGEITNSISAIKEWRNLTRCSLIHAKQQVELCFPDLVPYTPIRHMTKQGDQLKRACELLLEAYNTPRPPHKARPLKHELHQRIGLFLSEL